MITEAGSRNLTVAVNKAFTDLTGYSSEEVLGKSPAHAPTASAVVSLFLQRSW